ncbi:hypothetical protein DNTS_017510 [Danionella cerebrum]|uniref:Uncharacterized protein n=1 Tax=Danionella cerebrum TaxID=2873325 RepID=A0A553R8E1_9TELE|nr:hypothetical protein DNTS_017510 [Danionella translucida]
MDSCVPVNVNDSSSSSDAADVLIHSTRASRGEMENSFLSRKSQKTVNIYITKLSESEQVHSVEGTGNPPLPLENFPAASGTAEDIEVSSFSANGRGAVSAAIRKRSQNAPLRRNVSVQVLDRDGSPPQTVQPDPTLHLGDPGTSMSAQSEMEAQIVRVSAELRRLQAPEGSVAPSRVADGENLTAARAARLEEHLNILIQQRLQHLETVQCQQIELQNRLLGSALDVVTYHGNRESQLIVNSTSGILQTDLVRPQIPGSLGNRQHVSSGSQADSSDVRSRMVEHKSPLETPAPRRVIPQPTHWTERSWTSLQKNQGNGRLQDQSTNNQRSPERCALQSVGERRFAIATANNGQPELSR